MQCSNSPLVSAPASQRAAVETLWILCRAMQEVLLHTLRTSRRYPLSPILVSQLCNPQSERVSLAPSTPSSPGITAAGTGARSWSEERSPLPQAQRDGETLVSLCWVSSLFRDRHPNANSPRSHVTFDLIQSLHRAAPPTKHPLLATLVEDGTVAEIRAVWSPAESWLGDGGPPEFRRSISDPSSDTGKESGCKFLAKLAINFNLSTVTERRDPDRQSIGRSR